MIDAINTHHFSFKHTNMCTDSTENSTTHTHALTKFIVTESIIIYNLNAGCENRFLFFFSLLSLSTSSAQRRQWHWSWSFVYHADCRLEMSVVMVWVSVMLSCRWMFIILWFISAVAQSLHFLLLPFPFINLKRQSHHHIHYYYRVRWMPQTTK